MKKAIIILFLVLVLVSIFSITIGSEKTPNTITREYCVVGNLVGYDYKNNSKIIIVNTWLKDMPTKVIPIEDKTFREIIDLKNNLSLNCNLYRKNNTFECYIERETIEKKENLNEFITKVS